MKIYKLIVNIPESHAEIVRTAIWLAGAWRVGNYSFCSFQTHWTGRFLPMSGAEPTIWKVWTLEAVEEVQIQVDVFESDLGAVMHALKESHPYEEIGYDIFEKMSPETLQNDAIRTKNEYQSES